ncbi:hypothetical protein AVEN_243426-1 [Araneus ventricosus]|uniref:Uncharacterized protein n=1 Tax=Araneus ventricosus TaxID=182803 RepID=A0A4Y2PXX4_ARAVE|nr:hypothetical protein AVEN_243426-1 [Araneus ventricosus]
MPSLCNDQGRERNEYFTPSVDRDSLDSRQANQQPKVQAPRTRRQPLSPNQETLSLLTGQRENIKGIRKSTRLCLFEEHGAGRGKRYRRAGGSPQLRDDFRRGYGVALSFTSRGSGRELIRGGGGRNKDKFFWRNKKNAESMGNSCIEH